MRLTIAVTTAVLIAIGLADLIEARSFANTTQLREDKQCQKCNLTGAEVKGARQQRQEQRQEVRQQRQEQRQDVRQQRQEQRQQQQDVRQNPQPEVRQQRQEQRQQRQEVRQQRQEQRQQRQDARPYLQPDAWPSRQEQRQQRQDVRQQRQEQRQDVRQERQEQRYDVRRDWLREQEAWWLPRHEIWWLPEQEVWWHQYGESVSPFQSARSVKVHLISLTKDKVRVLVEGVSRRQEIAFDGSHTRKTVYLSPGTYKIWFKDIGGNPWLSGTLNLRQTNLTRIAFHKGKRLVRVCDDQYAWMQDRYSSTESMELNRTLLECPEVANKN